MYIKTEDVSQTMYLKELKSDLERMLEEEKISSVVSDVVDGIEKAIKKVNELLKQFDIGGSKVESN